MSGPNGERDGRQLKIAKCKQTFAQMEKWASEELRMPPAAIFRQWRHSALARVQKFCLRDTRKCDDSGEKEERGERRTTREGES